ncbi:MAG: hypothetical protein KC503_37800 [Myxococcales bacterium]|nr:hypothetical protein [Myxococcales bacterium]
MVGRGALVASLLVAALVLTGLLASVRDARASGSVGVTVADTLLTLEIKQTFRKILARGSSRGYYEGVRKQFVGIARAVLPRLAKVVRRFRRGARALMPIKVTLPVVSCERGEACPGKVGSYPALVEVARLSRQKNSRYVYVVSLALRRALSKAQLARLTKALQRALDAEPGSSDKGPSYDRPAMLKKQIKGISFAFRATYNVAKVDAENARMQKRLAFVARRVAAEAAKLARKSGIKLVPFSRHLPFYSKRQTKLPARTWLSFGSDLVQAQAELGVGAAPSYDAVRALTEALSKVAKQALGRAP